MIQMVVRNKESCEKQKLEALPNGGLLPPKEDEFMPREQLGGDKVYTVISAGSHSVHHW
jgi:hypothetical protein